MTIRYTENSNIGTSGANAILLTDENGKIPALDGSALTNLSSPASNGANYSYIRTDATSFTPAIDKFYYITQANTKASLGGNTVVMNMPYNTSIINGSKFGIFFIPTNSAINGGQYQLVTPLNTDVIAAGLTSFELWIDGASYSDGDIYTSKQGANRTREFYAYVNGTDLKFFAFNGGNKTLKEMIINFDLDTTTTYASLGNRPQLLAVKNNSTLATNGSVINVPTLSSIQSGDANLTFSMTTNVMPNFYRHLFITAASTINFGYTNTLPAASTTEGLIFIPQVPSSYWGTNTQRFANFQVAASNNFFYNAGTATTSSSHLVTGSSPRIYVSNGTNYFCGVYQSVGG